jgi:hypothetical protein
MVRGRLEEAANDVLNRAPPMARTTKADAQAFIASSHRSFGARSWTSARDRESVVANCLTCGCAQLHRRSSVFAAYCGGLKNTSRTGRE